MNLYAFKLAIGFQQQFACLSPFWLVHQATFLSQNLIEQGFDTWNKMTSDWKASWGLPKWETLDIPTPPKNTFDAIKHAFIGKEWNSFHVLGKKLDYVHPKDFLNYECESLLPTAPQTIDLPLKLASGRLSQSLGIKEYVNFVMNKYWKMRYTLCWSTPSTTPLEIGPLPYFRM